jgi:hypothetical protein
VKQLTLEQLDDLFRLDVISADTQIWQEGMDEWLPLSVVAGLGDDEPPISIPVSAPPPRSAQRIAATTSTAWPPVATAPAPAAVSSWPPAVSFGTTAPLSTRPPPPSARSNPPVSDPLSSWPPAAAWSDPPRAASVSPLAATVAANQFADNYVSPRFEDTTPGARVGVGGAWVIVLSVIVGVAVTLYRNAVVHAAAGSMGQTASYMKLESALGGPGFGTPRMVDQMTARPPAEDTTMLTAPALPTPKATATSEPVAAPAPKPTATEAAAPSKPAEAPKAQAPASPPRATPVSAPRSGGGSSSPDPDKVFKQPKKGKGNAYDPLNPTL